MDTSPTTELAAVNLILAGIGESPVNTLEATGVVDASMARQRLAHVAREVQERGWHWNTDAGFTLAPDAKTGELTLPHNTLRVDTSGVDRALDLVQRGRRMYDRKRHTYAVGREATVELVSLLDFDEMPEAAKLFVTIRAARQFVEAQLGSDTISAFTRRDEQAAWAALMRAEIEAADDNMLTGSWSVAEVLSR